MNTELMKQRRKELNLRQQDLADKCGLSRVTILNYENKRFKPKPEHITILAHVLGVDVIELTRDVCEVKPEDYYKRIQELEIAFHDKVTQWIEERYKNSDINTDYIVNLITNITGKRVLYSEEFDRVIFYGTKNTSCPFAVVDLYLNNLITSTKYLNDVSSKDITDNTFDCLLSSVKPAHSGA